MGIANSWEGYGIFSKVVGLKNDYAFFAFFSDGNNRRSLILHLEQYEDNNIEKKFVYRKHHDFNYIDFRPDVQSNGLVKLNDDRLVLFTTEDYNNVEYGSLHMFLIDFYNNYAIMKLRDYQFYKSNKRFAKEMSASLYNGYVIFTATLGNSAQSEIFAIMMIFGFANGTDFTTDISPYLMDTGYYSNTNNLYDFLFSTMKVDNNIFGYEKIEKIRLVKICDELLLYKGKGASKENSVISPNDLFDANHTLLQNREIQKEEDKLYTLEYQFVVNAPDYNTFYSMPNRVINGDDASQYYEKKTFDGRTNILSFKL